MYRPVQNEKPKVIMTSGVNVIKDCHNAEFDGFEVSRVEVSYTKAFCVHYLFICLNLPIIHDYSELFFIHV